MTRRAWTVRRPPGRAFVCALVCTVALAPDAARLRARASQSSFPAWRAAALASFDDVWQTVDQTFFDPAFGGVDWPAVRKELRPEVETAANEEAAREVIRQMLARLKESHFVLLSDSPADADALPGDAVVPIDVRVLSAGLVVTAVADDATRRAIRPGQIIMAIDGQPVATWLRDAKGGDARARAFAIWRLANRALHGAEGSMAHLRLRDPDGRDVPADVRRVVPPGQVVTLGNLPPLRVRVAASEIATPAGRTVGLIAFNYWMTAIDGPVADAVDRARQHAGLIIDLRGNPGGLAGMMRGVAGQIFDEPVTLGTSRTRDASLIFTANPRLATTDGRRVTPFAGPVAVLVDDLTGSTSECFAAAVQSLHRARIFGQQTMGQALPAMTKRLPDGDVLMYAVGDFVTATGRRVEGEGVVPDVPVPLTVAALAAGRDPVIEAALGWFDQAAAR